MVYRSEQKDHQHQRRWRLILFFVLAGALVVLQIHLAESSLSARGNAYLPDKNLKPYMISHQYSVADWQWLKWVQFLSLEKHHELLAKILETVVYYSPSFYRAYLDGGTFLSVFTEEKLVARQIFSRGVQQFPTDWQLPFRAAYHELFELKDEARAAELLSRAAQLGAPAWAAASAADIFSRQGRIDLARQTLQKALEAAPNRVGVEKVKAKLEEIERRVP